MSAATTDLATEVSALLVELASRRRDQVFRLGAELELSPPLLFALKHLEPGEPLPMSALAEHLRCDNSNVTGIVDRLESRGLVERRPATHDRRVKHLIVTPEGAALRSRLVGALAEAPAELDRLTPPEQRQLRDLLAKALAD